MDKHYPELYTSELDALLKNANNFLSNSENKKFAKVVWWNKKKMGSEIKADYDRKGPKKNTIKKPDKSFLLDKAFIIIHGYLKCSNELDRELVNIKAEEFYKDLVGKSFVK